MYVPALVDCRTPQLMVKRHCTTLWTYSCSLVRGLRRTLYAVKTYTPFVALEGETEEKDITPH